MKWWFFIPLFYAPLFPPELRVSATLLQPVVNPWRKDGSKDDDELGNAHNEKRTEYWLKFCPSRWGCNTLGTIRKYKNQPVWINSWDWV